MPEQPSIKKSLRMALVLEAIQRLSGHANKWVTLADLVRDLRKQGHDVDKYHVRRDLADQVKSGIHAQLECNDRGGSGTAYGYRWSGKEKTPDTGLTLPQALSLILVERHLSQALPASLTSALDDTFRKARRALDLHKGSIGARWLEKIAVVSPMQPLQPPKISNEILTTVHDAVINEEQLEVTYQAPQSVEKKITLHPLGLMQRGVATYLVATAFDYEDVMLYALHRIKAAARLHLAVNKTEGFTVEAYAAQQGHFGTGKSITLQARVSEHLAAILEETPLDEQQTLSIPDADGRQSLTAKVRDTWQLRWWILSEGDRIVIEKPVAMRKEIAQTISCVAVLYGRS